MLKNQVFGRSVGGGECQNAFHSNILPDTGTEKNE